MLRFAIIAAALAIASPAFADPCEARVTGYAPGATVAGEVRYVGDADSICIGIGTDPAGWTEIRLSDFYGPELTAARGRYSPPVCIGTKKHNVEGAPDPEHISTSYVERANLSIRMQQRRFTRLTNAFSKKAENHVHAVALHFFAHNFLRVHSTLSKGRGKTTPAMAAGLTTRPWTVEDMLALMDPNRLLGSVV